MLQKIDLDKVINDQGGEEKDTKKVIPEYYKDLNVAGYHTLVCLYNDLTDYIEKYRDLLLKGCKGLINAQEEIKNEFELLLQFNKEDFDYLEKLLIERQNLINNKGE